MKANKAKSHIGILKRICALVLCTAMIIGVMPQMSFNKAEAANTAQSEALNKLVQWGVMRGDQAGNLSPERAITRAEFVTMVNRAFGYTKTGAQPFKDVDIKDWFYDDISTAYNIGYLSGTSKTTASPNDNLTREAAVVILCRNIMLKEKSGEDLSFTDSRTASSWSRGFIKAAAEKGIVSGDPSGTFRPLANITRGEVAILLSRIIGTPVKDKGTYSNNVSGNVMVSTSGVTLDNMVITGDLYITAGVGLGYVTLNNVHVYGQIIVSGAGESNKGDCSIIIKNSSASEMIVDNLSNQYVTVRTMGSTIINKTSVQTNAYLEDKCTSDYGMLYIEVNGEEGTKLDLSGNIKEVVTITPESEINVGSGTVEKMTVDEAATDSTVNISQGAVVEILNLDTATTVNGKGDIGSLYVNAPGCKVEMLPDYIYIRPGITANINGIEMDSTLAQQMSDKPRILTGYPRSDDIGPNQIITKFQTNKSGTIYWAIRLSGDGVMVADDIITPPSYGAKVVKNGNINVNDANTTVEVKTTGLEIDTSYVLSAVFVDSRGDKSPVKTLYFTTPDDSKPAFTSGYPKASTIEDTYVVFDVATSKNCTLYWAIYKKGMTAPTANNFKDNSLSGAIDSGSLKMIKNEDDSITMGNILEDAKNALQELTDYDVYFFLTDSVNDSAVTKVSITTADRTPPEFLTNYPRITKVDAKALTGEGAINEDGKIYWALVKRGTEYPIVNPSLNNPDDILLDQKLQIKGGMYSLKSGSVSAKEDVAASINFSGLEAEGAYDIYFVAEDNHGNLSDIKVIENAKTLDSTAPEWIEQIFSQTNDEGKPLADTDVTIVFSEDIYHSRTRVSLLELYQSSEESFTLYGSDDTITFEDIINQMFTFKNLDITDPNNQVLHINIGENKENISVELNEDGQTEVTFTAKALGLKSGNSYQFILNYITDASNNNMPRNTEVDEFRTLDAQINLTQLADVSIEYPSSTDSLPIDVIFSSIPFANSTANASPESYYDIIFASDTNISFELYRNDGSGWKQVKSKTDNGLFTISHTVDANRKWTALSLNSMEGLNATEYKKVIKFPENGFEFAVILKSINLEDDPNKWDATVTLNIFCIAGNPNQLSNLSQGSITSSQFDEALNTEKISCISNPFDFSMEIRKVNQSAPQFKQSFPQAEPGDSVTKINYMLDREGTVYCVVAPAADPDNGITTGKLDPIYETGYGPVGGTGVTNPIQDAEFDIGDTSKSDFSSTLLDGPRDHHLKEPISYNIQNPFAYPDVSGYRSKKQDYPGSGVSTITIEDLEPNTKYNIYFVLEGSYKDPSPVMVYTFNTGDIVPPILSAYGSGSNAGYTIYPNEAQGQTSVIADTWWSIYPFSTTGTSSSYPKKLDTVLPDITDDEHPDGMTVLQALMTIDRKANDNYFNLYASEEDKKAIYELIAYPQSASPTATYYGNKESMASDDPETRTNTINEELTANNHIMLVVAKNELAKDSGYVFAVVDGLTKVDTGEPLIENITQSGKFYPTNGIFSGTVTITFDRNIYVQANTGVGSSATQITKYSQSAGLRSAYNLSNPPLSGKWSDDIIPSDNNISITTAADKMITLNFNRISIGSSVTIAPRIVNTKDPKNTIFYSESFCSEQGDPRQYPVTISFELDETGNNCVCVIRNGSAYDGLTSEVPEED